MKPIVVSVNEWTYPDRTEYASASSEFCADAPRRGYASAQILLPGTKAGQSLAVEAAGFSFVPEVYRMIDVAVPYNTGTRPPLDPEHRIDASAYTVRKAPYRVFDCLAPLAEKPVTAEGMTALYVAFPISENVKPGLYDGTLKIYAGNEFISLPVHIRAHKALVPQKGKLQSTHWFRVPCITKRSGSDIFSDAWFSTFASLLKLMHRARQTMTMVSFHLIQISEDGENYDFTKMGRLIRACFDGGLETVALGHLIRRMNYHWMDPENQFVLFFTVNGKEIPCDSPEGHRLLEKFLNALKSYLEAEGWYGRVMLHVGDEPTTPVVAAYHDACSYVRRLMPGTKTLDAISSANTGDSISALNGALDIYIPTNEGYQENREVYEKIRADGGELWDYTCCGPMGSWLNRMLDFELLRPRLLFYGNYRFHLTGYLHWSYASFDEESNPFEDTYKLVDDGTYMLPPGDTHIGYPDEKHGYWMGMRAEALRGGIEDLELLWKIAEKAPATADTLCEAVMRDFLDYTKDVCAFDRNYQRLLEAADALENE